MKTMTRAGVILLVIAMIAVGTWLALEGVGGGQSAPDGIMVVKARHEAWLMALPGVTGVAIGECEAGPCIKIFVAERKAESINRIPEELDGFETDIQVSGPIQRQPLNARRINPFEYARTVGVATGERG